MSNRALMVGVLMLAACVSQADVFNMGGTRNPTTGTWTGLASLGFVTVGNPGNAADSSTGYGSVGYTYQMGKYDVTVGQYCQFLNAVAKTDTYGLYSTYMATNVPTFGITQNGSSGSYSYSVTGSYGAGVNCPIFDTSWGDAARFCNWLQNGQPTGGEGPGSTETGAYTLNGATTDSALMAITRNAGATYVIPSENEWYKAAYYNPSNASYWLYPTQSNTAPSNVLSATGKNNANYETTRYTDPTNKLTPVGAFAASPGPYGTYDMGGDLSQWTEGEFLNATYRGWRGGVWYEGSQYVASTDELVDPPTGNPYGGSYGGFRVAEVPEPSSITLVVCGGLCLLALAWRRHRAA